MIFNSKHENLIVSTLYLWGSVAIYNIFSEFASVVKLGRCVSNAIGTLLTGVEKLNQWRKIKVMLMILTAQALELETDQVLKQLKYVEVLRPRVAAKRKKSDCT
ncbi:uncharacterized protein [Phaseolus vulgaris]|uniref:uncharacterized protein n=1 Tax=Phaseolus vulgaris TaxID=3885 RepID=UPI0035C98666